MEKIEGNRAKIHMLKLCRDSSRVCKCQGLLLELVQYLRDQAKGTIKEYVTEHLPEQYQVCFSALDTIIKHTSVIMATSDDNREKLQAMELFKDTHLVKLELLSNATTIDSGLNYIRSKQSQQTEHKKRQGQGLDSASDNGNNDDQLTTTTTTTAAGRQTVF